MATDAVQGTNTANQYILTEQVRQQKTELGKDDFLKIFLTQLQNQDPTSPMENIDSIAQMAQFSALEAMTNISNVSVQSQTYAMIGKGIIGVLRDESTGIVTDVIGTVDSAGVENGKPYVMVGNQMVWAEDVSQVFDKSIISGEATSIMAGAAIVGKFARAETVIDGQKAYLEGIVERMSMKEGRLYVTISENEVALNQIINVADTAEALGPIPAEEIVSEEETVSE